MSTNSPEAKELQRLIRVYQAEDRLRLAHSFDQETGKRLARRARFIGRTVSFHDRTPRLMTLARAEILKADLAGTDCPSGCVWWANSLELAKGRMARRWWSPPGGAYLCICIYPSLLMEHWSFYNLGIGVAIAQVIREQGIPATIRWVNDILVGGKKLAGVLTEAVQTPHSRQTYLLVGIGINVNIPRFPEHLSFATSLSSITGSPWPIREVGARVLARLGWIFGMLHEWEASCLGLEQEERPWNPVAAEWIRNSDTPGRRVLYGLDADLAPEFQATAVGLAPDGGLRLTLDDGYEFAVNAGEVRYLEPCSGDTLQ